MANTNIVILGGNLTRDPELRHTNNDKAVTTLNIAVNEYYNGNSTVSYIEIEVWGKDAENSCSKLNKGSGVLVTGKIKTKSWDDRNTGQKRYKTYVQALRVDFLNVSNGSGSSDNGYSNIPEF